MSDFQNIIGVWHVIVMMDIEVSCKGHCEKLSHYLDHVSHTVYGEILLIILTLSLLPLLIWSTGFIC